VKGHAVTFVGVVALAASSTAAKFGAVVLGVLALSLFPPMDETWVHV
jgi:hypothetical protein